MMATPIERLKRKLTIENLWLYILTLLKDGPKYPYEIPDLMEKRFGWKPARVTGYIVMKRLEMDGYIRIVRRKSSQGRVRNYYELTDKGREALREAEDFLRGLVNSLFGSEEESVES